MWPRFHVWSFGLQDRGDIEAATCFGQGHGLPVRLGGQVWAGAYAKIEAHEFFMQMMGGVAEGRGAQSARRHRVDVGAGIEEGLGDGAQCVVPGGLDRIMDSQCRAL